MGDIGSQGTLTAGWAGHQANGRNGGLPETTPMNRWGWIAGNQAGEVDLLFRSGV